LEEFIRSFDIRSNQKKSVQYGTIPNPTRPMLTVLPGLLFSGDAGGFTFPLTKGGVIGALFSGRAAGEVIRDALIEDNPEILSTYSDRIKLHPSRSRVALFYLYKFLLLNNNSLNAVGEIIDHRLYSEIPVINALCYLSKKPNLETANGFLIGFAAQQILGHFRRYIF
jgi:flavin-dependent dehydrogenase